MLSLIDKKIIHWNFPDSGLQSRGTHVDDRLSQSALMMSEPSREAKRRSGEGERPAQVARFSSLDLPTMFHFHRLLCMERLDVNVDLKELSAMMFAYKSGCEELTKIMLENNKFDPSLRDKNGNGLLHFAVQNNNLHIVDLLLTELRITSIINDRNNSGTTPLTLACTNGFFEIARKLLKFQSVDVNSSDDNGDSPLLHAVFGEYEEIVWKLLEHPQIKVNKPNEHGDNPLIVAANYGCSDIVARLLKHEDIDVNSSNIDGYSSLMCASDNGFQRIVELLLAHPDIDINHKANLNPATFFLSFSHFLCRMSLETVPWSGLWTRTTAPWWTSY